LHVHDNHLKKKQLINLKVASLQLYSLLLLLGCLALKTNAQTAFMKTSQGRLVLNGQQQYYIGTNYWYGGLLGNTADGKIRLKKELDFLNSHGVNNLRVMVGAEGSGNIIGVQRVGPALQPTQGIFNTELLNGLDYLLAEMGKRKMKAVLFLSNNWEWSGGFLQYLNWNGLIADSVLHRKLSWEEYRDLGSQFYTCEPCKAAYKKQLQLVVTRTNHYTQKKYTEDEAIMSWEIANEPRPMRPTAINAYTNWISNVAATIKQLDKNHLLTIGTEGYIGTENRSVYTTIHADKNIDYLSIHIWPKNWQWFTGTDLEKQYDSVIIKTKNYINEHVTIAKKLNKPLIIEEFGLPRDHQQFDPQSSTNFRDRYYKEIFTIWQQNRAKGGIMAGCNFWAFGGTARPIAGQIFWKTGNDYMGDPPMEEQGLNTVFDSDQSTWKWIDFFTQRK
jgi:mannan endo-1,4-beta-mannosidase